jgi:hypothetical protein
LANEIKRLKTEGKENLLLISFHPFNNNVNVFQEKEIKRLKTEGKENLSLISLQLLELQVFSV